MMHVSVMHMLIIAKQCKNPKNNTKALFWATFTIFLSHAL